jgi:hypothetical protein
MKITINRQLWLPALLVGLLGLAACNEHHQASSVTPTPTTGTVAGTVTNAQCAAGAPGAPIAGATVTVTAGPTTGATATTDASGAYTLADLAAGDYTLTVAATNFTSQTVDVSVTAGSTATGDAGLSPTATAQAFQITVEGTPDPGGQVQVTATPTALVCNTVASYHWTQANSVPLQLANADSQTVTATLPATTVYKDEFFRILREERGEIEYDSEGNIVEDPDTQEPARGTAILNRYMVMGITPADLDEASTTVLTVTATDSGGQTYTQNQSVTADLPFKVGTGLQTVPVGVAVLLHGMFKGTEPSDPPPTTGTGADSKPIPESPDGYTWTVTGPGNPALSDAVSQDPWFTPTQAGTYTVSVNIGGQQPGTLTIYAGNWVGLITGQDGDGKPTNTGSCFPACHGSGAGAAAPGVTANYDQWRQSGHAVIFSDNVDAGGHYSQSCFSCHTVGFESDDGMGTQSDYNAMLDAIFTNNGSPPANPDNWTTILANYPDVAKLANIQCENCHGPNDTAAHATFAGFVPERFSMSSDVCGACHGEPLRHGRFQQWQESGHANYDVAVGEGFSNGQIRNSCAGCHTGQGFLVWLEQLRSGDASRVLTPDSVAKLSDVNVSNVVPQVCVVCHDPHFPGTSAGPQTDAQPRVTDNTPKLPAGFAADSVGKGAMCITCHNSRNGEASNGEITLHEDGDPNWGTLTSFSAPHEACQGDVLMGRNAYFVTGVRSPHSQTPVDNTCVTCHMVLTPAPPELSIEGNGTNHFFKADTSICANCHQFTADSIQAAGRQQIDAIQTAFEQAVTRLKGDSVPVSYTGGRQPRVTPAGGTATAIPDYLPNLTADQTDILAKANWNYSLLEQDASESVHNPGLYRNVSSATVTQLNALQP